MRIIIEKVDNGFLVEHPIYNMQYNGDSCTYERCEIGMKRHVALTLEGAFAYVTEILK